MQHQTRSALLLLTASSAAMALALSAGGPTEGLAVLRAAGSAADPFAPLVAAVTLLAQLLAGYLMVVSGCALAAGLPGLLGRAARACAARLSPPLLQRLLGVALGVTTAIATVGAGPATAAEPGTPRAGTSMPALDWPTLATTTAPAAPLDWPTPAAEPTTTATAPTPVGPATAGVTVSPGDTLWGIAARHLPAGAGDAAIARAWPAWWSANRAAVGADPDLITPGTHLAPPAPPAR